MRAAWLPGVLLLLSLPTADAQPAEGPAPEVRILDPAGDHALRLLAQDTVPLGSNYAHIDIREVWLSNETPAEFEFGMRLTSWTDPRPSATAQVVPRLMRFEFRFDNQNYSVVNTSISGSQCRPEQALLLHRVGVVGCLRAAVDVPTSSWRVWVPKESIRSASQVPAQEGDTIEGIYAYVWQFVGPATGVIDFAPAYGAPRPSYLLQKGLGERQGNLFLVPAVPVRASNGEATTMVFPIKLTNRGAADDVVVLSAQSDYEVWSLRVPPRVRAPVGETVVFPVILTMPFTHDHGVTRYLNVTAESTAEPEHFTRIPLGVHWLEIPQPAGHHDRLWLHSAPQDDLLFGVPVPAEVAGSREAWINAAETDPRKDALDDYVPGQAVYQRPGETYWAFPLQPGLQIGLDFDGNRTGLLETKIRTTLPATSATLEALLEYCPEESPSFVPGYCRSALSRSVPLLRGQSPPRSLAAGAETAFQIELKVDAAIDRVPFQPGSTLKFYLVLRSDVPQSLPEVQRPLAAQVIVKGSTLTVPLTEYHDPVDQAFESIGAIRVTALDPQEKRVNAGRGAAFRFDVTNTDKVEHRLRVFAEGINAEWATVVGDSEFTLRPDDRRQSTLLVQVPEDAQPGERAELFFVVEGIDDPSLVALSRMRAEVVDIAVAEMSDEAGILDNNAPKDTPAPGVAMVLLASLAVVALRVRRR